VVNRAVKFAGVGIFTVGDNAIAEDYQIVNIRVVDPALTSRSRTHSAVVGR
jgi:hypothetical protein